jgi:endonuclease YncB( thermonuclease family)
VTIGRFLVLVWAVCLAALAVGQTAAADDIIRLNGENWRLHGIDLPDPNQTCGDGWRAGEVSRAAVQRLTEGAKLECRNTAKDQFSRPVATCRVNGEDLGAALVRQGLAWASLRQTWRYFFEDWMAWLHGNGIRAHRCDKPSEWRARSSSGSP